MGEGRGGKVLGRSWEKRGEGRGEGEGGKERGGKGKEGEGREKGEEGEEGREEVFVVEEAGVGELGRMGWVEEGGNKGKNGG